MCYSLSPPSEVGPKVVDALPKGESHGYSKQDFHRDHPGKVLTGPPPVAKTARLVAVLLAASHVSKRCVAATALEAKCTQQPDPILPS